MSRFYAVTFENVAVTAAQDFFELTAGDDKPIRIAAIYLSQSTETGDAAEEMLRVKVIRGHTTSGSGGTAPTPVALDPAYAAAGFSAEVNNTTIASAGTAVDVHAESFNVRVGVAYVPPPDQRPQTTQTAGTLVCRLMAAPADSVSLSGTIIVEEL